MINLIRKELSVNVKYDIIGLVLFIFYMYIFAGNGKYLFMMCAATFYYALFATNLSIDEKYKTDLLFGSLPLKRKQIIISKYATAFICFIISSVVYTFFAFGLRAAGVNVAMLSLSGAMLGLLTISLFNAIILPISYKFGAQSTRYVIIGIFFVFFFISIALSNADISDYIMFLASLSEVQLSLILLLLALIVSAISFAITNSIYAKKDF